ncbi:hypothetical protein RHGRI_030325 [Rhododendron griersonianum]|uniref:Uncharacterized protein n=1 Tax=Rhododendron griersonianum TaxID=479676 RepID=A0AAV6ISY1_9ERIC|nr:hypothetical protein RHGRI_030325 [Rhododendron griersonianum]
MEEEDTFRTIPSTNQLVPNFEVYSVNEEEDDEVDKVDDELVANKNKKRNSVDDMEIQGIESVDDRAKLNEEEVERVEANCIIESHPFGLEKEPVFEKSFGQRKSIGGKYSENMDSCENNNDESSNSDHGLESFVQDSLSLINEDCFESVHKNFPDQNEDSNLEVNKDQDKEVNEANSSGAYDSNVALRASQLPDINLHIELNPRLRGLEKAVGADELCVAFSTPKSGKG